jgi:hypothetical protein
MLPKIEKSFELKATITLKDDEIVILNGIPFSKSFLQHLSWIFEGNNYPGMKEDLIAGLAGHMWLISRLDEDAPFSDYQEQFFTICSNLFDSMKDFEKIKQFEKE